MASVHLIDGHVYIFRAYHSMPSLEAPDGTPTGAVRGFASTLLKYLADPGITHAAVCFDYAMESFRNDIYPEYKANRGETPDDLEPQFALCVEVAQALGIPVYSEPGWEADDLIATLTQKLARRGNEAVVVTTDKDLSQLVREDGRVVLHDLAKEQTFDADGVRAKFGVSPEQIPDYLGLVGDVVDNLPGVPGVGPKSASAALMAFGDIEGIPADPADWSEVAVRGAARIAQAIDTHRDQALRTRELATVEREVPGLAAGIKDVKLRLPDLDVVEPLFERLGWGRILDQTKRWRRRP